MFNAIDYFETLCAKNKLCISEGFHTVLISSPEEIDGLHEQYRDYDRFVAVSDTSNENVESDDGEYAFTKGRAFNVSIVSGYEYNNMEDRQKNMEICREVFRQFLTRIIRDKFLYADEGRMQLVTSSIPVHEYNRLFLNETTGLYFTLYSKEPIDLQYDEQQWTD